MIITKQFTMALDRRDPEPLVDTVQGDSCSRAVAITLTSGGQPWNIPDDTTATMRYLRPDGTGGAYENMPDGSTAFTMQDNTITAVIAPELLTAPGQAEAQIEMASGDKILATFSFFIMVQADPQTKAALSSSPAEAGKVAFYFTVTEDEDGAYTADRGYQAVLRKHQAGYAVHCKIEVAGVVYLLPINWEGEGALSFAGPVGDTHVSVVYDSAGEITVVTQPLATQAELEALRETVAGIQADLAYVPIDITKLSCSQAGVYELGTVVEALIIFWALNKDPVKQVLDGVELAADVRSKALTPLGGVSANKTYTLTVTDERGATDDASISLSFYNGVYYGVLEDGAEIDSAAILTLDKKLQSGRGLTFTDTAAAGQRHAYALPARYGTPTFKDAETGFPAGMELAATFDFTNASGYTESYNVWLSEELGLGSMTIVAS